MAFGCPPARGAGNILNLIIFVSFLSFAPHHHTFSFFSPQRKIFTADIDRVQHDPTRDGGSSVTGHVRIVLYRNNMIQVTIRASGLAPNLPHAQHIHGFTDPNMTAQCPSEARRDAMTDDGLISTPEAASDYGPILASLTTRGDTSPSSALALPRFPVADSEGNLYYQRKFAVSKEVASMLDSLHIVIHGIDINNNGEYDFEAAGPSPLTDDVPFEATIPAGCGTIDERARRPRRLHYDLSPVQHKKQVCDSRASGYANIRRCGNRLFVTIEVFNASPNLPHAQHIHANASGICPPRSARNNRVDDGLIDTVEGLPFYGPIQVSLTTSGDTSPASGLALSRFPVANDKGYYRYQRVIKVSDDVLDLLVNSVIVVHGIDINNNSEYDFGFGGSPLADGVPLEATLPAACGPSDVGNH